jgi:hypothetical protein
VVIPEPETLARMAAGVCILFVCALVVTFVGWLLRL